MIWKQFTHLGNFPPELKSRFNSFLTTEFDDSLSVEMQLRSIIKWCQSNFKTVDVLIDFINDISNWLKQFENNFDTKLEDSVISVLSEWQENGKLDVVINDVLQWQLDDYIATNEDDKLSITKQLQHLSKIEKVIPSGVLKIPKNFPTIPFNIYKNTNGEFNHDSITNNHINREKVLTIYITNEAGSGSHLGLTKETSITLNQFNGRNLDGLYDSDYTCVEFIFLDDVYNIAIEYAYLRNIKTDIVFKSGSKTGRTLLGYIRYNTDENEFYEKWTKHAGSTYVARLRGTALSQVPINTDSLFYGIPQGYGNVNTLAECMNKVNTYFVDKDLMYVNTREDINNISLLWHPALTKNYRFAPNEKQNVFFENMITLGTNTQFLGTGLGSDFYFYNCLHLYGLKDAFAIAGVYRCFSFNTYALYGNKDCFNYHTTNRELTTVVEVNCVGNGAGAYRMAGGNTDKASNNGSTAHEGLSILRVNCSYYECEGPIVADIENCFVVNLNLDVRKIVETTTGLKSGIYAHNNIGDISRPKYAIDCSVNGTGFNNGIIGVNTTVFVDNYRGNLPNSSVTVGDWYQVE